MTPPERMGCRSSRRVNPTQVLIGLAAITSIWVGVRRGSPAGAMLAILGGAVGLCLFPADAAASGDTFSGFAFHIVLDGSAGSCRGSIARIVSRERCAGVDCDRRRRRYISDKCLTGKSGRSQGRQPAARPRSQRGPFRACYATQT
jgi:hypothetical protein